MQIVRSSFAILKEELFSNQRMFHMFPYCKWQWGQIALYVWRLFFFPFECFGSCTDGTMAHEQRTGHCSNSPWSVCAAGLYVLRAVMGKKARAPVPLKPMYCYLVIAARAHEVAIAGHRGSHGAFLTIFLPFKTKSFCWRLGCKSVSCNW